MRRSYTITSFRLATLVGGLAVSVAVLSGCSAGQLTATAQNVPAVPGTNANSGPAGLRNGMVAFNATGYPLDGDAPLIVRLFNNSPYPLTLTGVSSPMAKEVRLVGGPSGTESGSPSASQSPSPSASASATASGSPTESGSPTATASPSESASPSATASPSPTPTKAGTTSVKLTIAPFGKLELVPGGAGQYLQLNGLSKEVLPGYVVPVSFTFTQDAPGGPQTYNISNVGLPMAPPPTPGPRVSVNVAPEE